MAAEPDTDVVRAEGFGLADMLAALEEAGRRFVALLRSLEPADGARAIPGMTWTVAECAAHMLTIIRRGLGDRRRAGTYEGLALLNDEAIAEVTERDVRAIADMIESDVARYAELLRRTPAELIASRVVDLHASVRSDIPTGISYQLFDFLGHGLDIARPTNRPWTIEPAHAALVLRASLPALRPWVRDEVLNGPRRRTAFTFPGSDGSIDVRTGGGAYEVHPAPRDAAEAEVDPADTFLAVAGRLEPEDAYIRSFASWYRPI